MTAQRERLVVDIHGIGAKPAWVEADENYFWCDDRQTFTAMLDAIPTITAATGVSVELTFDDGNASDATIAVPALLERGLSASFFVCAGRIGDTGYLDKSALLEMHAAGFAIGSHGWSHVDWRQTDSTMLDREVNGAKRKIEDTIGKAVDSVAIPFGSYDWRVLHSLDAFTTVYTSDDGMAQFGARIVPRWSYNKGWQDDTLVRLATDSENFLIKAKRAVKIALKQRR